VRRGHHPGDVLQGRGSARVELRAEGWPVPGPGGCHPREAAMTLEESLQRHHELAKNMFENCRDFIHKGNNYRAYEAICNHIIMLEARLDERQRWSNTQPPTIQKLKTHWRQAALSAIEQVEVETHANNS